MPLGAGERTVSSAPNGTPAHVKTNNNRSSMNMKQLFTIMVLASWLPATQAQIDRDGDGLGDIWQKLHSVEEGPLADSDQDGVNHSGESRAGTNPYDQDSFIRVRKAIGTWSPIQQRSDSEPNPGRATISIPQRSWTITPLSGLQSEPMNISLRQTSWKST